MSRFFLALAALAFCFSASAQQKFTEWGWPQLMSKFRRSRWSG